MCQLTKIAAFAGSFNRQVGGYVTAVVEAIVVIITAADSAAQRMRDRCYADPLTA